MPGRISFNGIHIDFQNEWVKFDDPINSNVSSRQSRSGIVEINKFFDQQIITAQMRLAPGQDEIQVRRFFEYANDGSTFELWRDRNLGAYISFEGGGNSATVPTITPRGLQTNDKVAGTFTRAGTADSAWFLDPSTGLMTVSPSTTANIPRFEAGKYGQHAIRIDGAAANLITNRVSNAAWTKSNMTAAPTTETLDPAGNNSNVDKLTATSASGNAFFNTSTAVGNNAAFGIWLKSTTGSVDSQLSIEGTTGSTGLVIKNIIVLPKWQRFAVSQDTTSYTGDLRARVLIEDNTDIIYSWFTPQLFDSAEFDLGTVGVLSTSTVTRGAEKLTFASANIMNRDKGTVAMWIKPSFDPTNPFGAAAMFFESGDSGGSLANLHIRCFYDGATADQIVLQIRGDNVDTTRMTLITNTTTGLTQNNSHHFGFTYDSTVTGGGHIYLDGSELTYASGDSNAAFNISEVGDTFAIGSELDGVSPSFSSFDEVLIMKDVKPASWFQQRFSSRFAIGEGRNYWSSVRLANLNYVRQALRGGRSTIPLEFEEVIT